MRFNINDIFLAANYLEQAKNDRLEFINRIGVISKKYGNAILREIESLIKAFLEKQSLEDIETLGLLIRLKIKTPIEIQCTPTLSLAEREGVENTDHDHLINSAQSFGSVALKAFPLFSDEEIDCILRKYDRKRAREIDDMSLECYFDVSDEIKAERINRSLISQMSSIVNRISNENIIWYLDTGDKPLKDQRIKRCLSSNCPLLISKIRNTDWESYFSDPVLHAERVRSVFENKCVNAGVRERITYLLEKHALPSPLRHSDLCFFKGYQASHQSEAYYAKYKSDLHVISSAI